MDFLGLEEGEWEKMSDEDKYEMADNEMQQHIEMGYEEKEE